MEKLNELVELAERADSAVNLMDAVNPHTILAIAEAFRELEQRAEAAEALNNHLELAVRKAEGVSESLRKRAEDAENKLLFTSPAPAADLAELDNFALFMADESIKEGNYPHNWQCKASNAAYEYAQACRATILRNIEEKNK